MLGALADEPRRVGKALVGDLAGLWSARRGDYRIVYEIDEGARTVLVHRVQHRRERVSTTLIVDSSTGAKRYSRTPVEVRRSRPPKMPICIRALFVGEGGLELRF